MYEFAILALGGLVAAKAVDVLRHVARDLSKGGVLLASMIIGVGLAYLLDFSVFAAWDIGVRTAWIGTVGTGLFMAGLAAAWHHALSVMRESAHRSHGVATELESRIRAA